MRLAELLSEEARYHYQLAYEREQRSTRVLHVPQVRLLKDEAISTYELVESRFPQSPLIPQVLFNIGHEHRELGNFDEMRAAYTKLVDNFPDTPLRANALLVLGDYYFDRNELTEAQKYYEEIVKAPLQPVTGLGHYKLAWVWVNNGECGPALTNFEAAIEKSNAWEARMKALREQAAETPLLVQQATAAGEGAASQEIDVRREALVDLAYCYSRLRKPSDSIAFYQKMAYNRATYVAALSKLANRYRTMDQFTGAMLTTRELLRLGPASIDRLDDARTLYTSIKRLKDYREVGQDGELIASALVRYYNRLNVKPDERKRMIDEFEVYLRDLATTSQERAGQNRKKSADPTQLARIYEAYLSTFPEAKERANMLLNDADVLASAGRDLEAGLAALEASDLIEDDNERRDALYDAVVHFQTSLEKASNQGRYERVTARASLRRAGATLLAYQLADDKERRVKFAIAQAVYDEGQYVEAIDKLTAVAYEFPQSKEADAAIRLALDSYNTINDYDGLMYASRRFMDGSSPASPELKGDIKRILAATEQRKLDELSLKAAGDEGGDIGVLIAFAEKNQGSDLGERALINAFVASRAVGDSENMYKLADSLAKNYPKSDQLPGIFTSLAQTAVARFDYDLAVQFLKQAADVNPSQKVQLLVAAGELNEQLGNVKKAESLFDDAIKGSSGQGQIEAVAKLAALTERVSSGKETLKALKGFESGRA
ncbi:MAG: tetratricopeptide repeat protein [bacterium]